MSNIHQDSTRQQAEALGAPSLTGEIREAIKLYEGFALLASRGVTPTGMPLDSVSAALKQVSQQHDAGAFSVAELASLAQELRRLGLAARAIGDTQTAWSAHTEAVLMRDRIRQSAAPSRAEMEPALRDLLEEQVHLAQYFTETQRPTWNGTIEAWQMVATTVGALMDAGWSTGDDQMLQLQAAERILAGMDEGAATVGANQQPAPAKGQVRERRRWFRRRG